MGIIKSIVEKHQNNIQEKNQLCEDLLARSNMALEKANTMFTDKKSFIDPLLGDDWQIENKSLLQELRHNNLKSLKRTSRYNDLLSNQCRLQNFSEKCFDIIHEHNEEVASNKVEEAYKVIGEVEGRKLDKQQMTCIVKDSHNHLVIAGAGTGKTTTIVGKIKYLLKTGQCKPEDILVLSFTNASASEMSERIAAETGYNIAASTFHKLGLNIITKVNDIRPKITQINLKTYIKEQILINMKSPKYRSKMFSYLLNNRVVSKSEFEFNSEEDYNEYLTMNPPITLLNEKVKSYGEMDIANFLYQNGIKYIYEYPYEVDTRTYAHSQYHPDFYLPDYNIYIEYFGINKKGEVPKYFKGRDGKSATQVYNESMTWKRQIHKANNTCMIECFAYEKFDGNLLDKLKDKLEGCSISLNHISSEELWGQVSSGEGSVMEGVIELFETLINLIKSNNFKIRDVRQLNDTGSNIKNNELILSLLEPIFDAYCTELVKNNEIDFNDMINLASQYIRDGKYTNPYKYVIVDEYQDISRARFELLNCLRKSCDYKLFCVGDDWQSIYRFAGSDIGFILNFKKYWGATEISRIETTYRFTEKLIEISGEFIMKNPAQIKKSIKGRKEEFGFPLGEISGYTDKYAIQFMVKKLNDLPKNSTVFFVGRYSFDVNLLNDSDLLICKYDNTKGIIDVKYKYRPDLNMSFITAHKSKGLQADYIFIINNRKSRMGFPSKIQDAPILELLLDNCDLYPYAEERRLFYVALTRAKIKTFIVTINKQESIFAMELKNKYGKELKHEQFQCPLCGGHLIKKSGQYGEFYGCSNYSSTGCTYKRVFKKHN